MAVFERSTVAVTSSGPAHVQQPGPRGRARAAAVVARWLPAALALAFTAAVLRFYGVTPADMAAFTGYLVLGISLPGTLLWRALCGSGRGRLLAEQVAAGTALGYALEVLSYIPARWLGCPRAVLAWPAAVIASFLVVPRLRGYWRGPGTACRAPLWWSWSISSAVAAVVAWTALTFFRGEGMSWPWYTAPYVDMPYHLALIGELRNHVPPAIPFVAGQPLDYHWFGYAEMAATSWVTGIEPQTLLYRLSGLPMMAVFIVLIAVIARRLTGRSWAGPLAVAMTYLALAPAPYRWYLPAVLSYRYPLVEDGTLVRLSAWSSPMVSPTQTFAAALFAAAILLLIRLLRGGRHGPGPWAALAVLLTAVMGAKATFLPLLAAGLATVLAGCLVQRRLYRPALAALAITLCLLLFAQFVLFGGATQGMLADPFHTVQQTGLAGVTGLGGRAAGRAISPVAALTLITVLCWAFIWSGIAGLAARPAALLEPPVLLLPGMGAAAMAVVLLFTQPGMSQGFFLQSARPYLAVACACGLVTAIGPACRIRRAAPGIAAACLGGLTLAALASRLSGRRPPTWRSTGLDHLLARLLLPYLALAAAIVLAAAAIAAARALPGLRRCASASASPGAGDASAGAGDLGRIGFVLIPAMMTGACLLPAAQTAIAQVTAAADTGWRHAPMIPGYRAIPAGAMTAGRWLRAHSGPGDLVATNVHCRAWLAGACDNRSFWVSAYSERRVLVEGWGYTERIDGEVRPYTTWVAYRPFWDDRLLAANDAVFRSPSAVTAGLLRDKYGVRWLFADRKYGNPSPLLGRIAQMRFQAGDCVIYELMRQPG